MYLTPNPSKDRKIYFPRRDVPTKIDIWVIQQQKWSNKLEIVWVFNSGL